MDYIARAFGFSQMEQTKKAQIETQRNLDQKVQQHLRTCPDVIARYYLSQREFSRQQHTRVIGTPVIDKFSIMSKELEENDKQHTNLRQALDHTCPCDALHKLLPVENQALPKTERKVSVISDYNKWRDGPH